jgi:glycosyltransferase involved in cell wall biosynthesis
MLDAEKLPSLKWIPWVEYEKLIDWISQADVCLGIFGASGKAARVIPNKVFQILAAGKPLITRDSPAIRELLLPDMDGVTLVPAADAPALADAVRELGTGEKIQGRVFHREVVARFQAGVLAGQLLDRIEQVAGLDSR